MKKIIFLILVALLVSMLVGCGLASQLEGTSWTYSETELGVTMSYTITFNADSEFVQTTETSAVKVGQITLPATSTTTTGTWSVDGDELTISYEDVEETFTVEIDGDKLILTASDGSSITYTKN